MPSIPQSLLWISLVVLWLFVLVPMLVSKRDAVRRTSDIALAARVLNSAVGARLLRRSGPAAGHASDPDWHDEKSADDDSEWDDAEDDEPETGSVEVSVGADDDDVLDADTVDEGAADLPGDDDDADREPDVLQTGLDIETGGAEYEYVDDTSGLETEADPQPSGSPIAVPAASRRRRYDQTTAAAVTARKYSFRKHMLLTMALVLAASAVVAFFTAASTAWWVCGSTAGVMMLYLGYLRRQTRIEERVRDRRAQRMARAGVWMDDGHGRDLDRGPARGVDRGFDVPSRLRRPGAAVLEIDDEDPVFEHLDYVPFARDFDWRGDLPRAAGQ